MEGIEFRLGPMTLVLYMFFVCDEIKLSPAYRRHGFVDICSYRGVLEIWSFDERNNTSNVDVDLRFKHNLPTDFDDKTVVVILPRGWILKRLRERLKLKFL